MIETKALIFDWGGVLGRFSHQQFCETTASMLPRCQAEEIYDFVFQNGENRMLNGGADDLSELHKSILKRFGGEISFEVFTESWDDIVVGDNTDIGKVLKRIRPQVKTVVLSNTNKEHWKRISRLPLMKKYFSDEDRTVLSFRCGFSKPDVRIFREAIKRCGCKPQNILYVDDVPYYVAAFEKTGGRGMVYNCEIDPVSNLEQALNTHNILQEKA